MKRVLPFRLSSRALLLALISAAFTHEAAAAAARVDFATSGVTATGADGRSRSISKGAEVDSGDTIRTENGRAQLRFTDGSYISLQPNSEFGIREYRFDGRTDGTERGFFSLVKGALRTVTGLVGRTNRNVYQIQTATATIGIRGTGGLVQIQPDGSTLVSGTSGIWSLTNAGGSIDIPAGTAGVAGPNTNTPPQTTSQGPSVGPAAPAGGTKPTVSTGDDTTSDGKTKVVEEATKPETKTTTTTPTTPAATVPLTSGSGFALAAAFASGALEQSGTVSASSVSTNFDSAGKLTASTAVGVVVPTLGSGSSQSDFNTDGILAWARWVGPATLCTTCSSENMGAASTTAAFHYVVGVPTAVLPTTGGGTYTLAGATSPNYGFPSNTTGGTFTGTLGVTFGMTTSLTFNFNVAMPDGKGFAMTGSTTTASSLFTGSPSITGSGGACACSCTSSLQGFFAGTNAERAGIAYEINDSFGSGKLLGAAAFKK